MSNSKTVLVRVAAAAALTAGVLASTALPAAATEPADDGVQVCSQEANGLPVVPINIPIINCIDGGGE